MNKNALYIVGSVALLGGAVFLFLKNKKSKDLKKLALTDLQTSDSVLPNATISSTSNKEEDLKKLEAAKGIATQINDLRNSKAPIKEKYDSLANSNFFKAIVNQLKKQIEDIDKNIETLNIALKSMGYTETNGNVLKIK